MYLCASLREVLANGGSGLSGLCEAGLQSLDLHISSLGLLGSALHLFPAAFTLLHLPSELPLALLC